MGFPLMLQGKSPCLMLEGCGGESRGPCSDTDGAAPSRAAALGLGCLQEHRYVVSVSWMAPTEWGSFSPLPCRRRRALRINCIHLRIRPNLEVLPLPHES